MSGLGCDDLADAGHDVWGLDFIGFRPNRAGNAGEEGFAWGGSMMRLSKFCGGSGNFTTDRC
jgi:hypothetical protein